LALIIIDTAPPEKVGLFFGQERVVSKNRKEPFSIELRGLSVPQAAAYFGISPNAYRSLMREGKVPQPIQIPGFERQIVDKVRLDAGWMNSAASSAIIVRHRRTIRPGPDECAIACRLMSS
jgi:hypothetical protein